MQEEAPNRSIACRAAMKSLKFYQHFISPLFPPSCRFIPTCSQYSLMAFEKYGFKNGMSLTLKRLSKCRPGGPYGFDPLP